ncbi:MAG: DUF2085 domain-containing protein [Ignavibacteria bacterium]|nr:DUF2085 domain-containing protein [Ignavibacteria bacterium]
MNKKIYFIFLTVSFVWTAFIFVIPVFAGMSGIFVKIADFGYIFYSKTCHQIDERSFFILGNKLAVCSRCSSSYAAFLLSVILYPIIKGLNNRNLPPLWILMVSLVLLSADVLLDVFDIMSNTFVTRTITGGIIGFVLPFYLIPGAMNFSDEIFVKMKKKNING